MPDHLMWTLKRLKEIKDLRSKLKIMKPQDYFFIEILDVLDKVLTMALECNLSADKMIKKIFIFIYTGDPFLCCWKIDSEPIRKKFEMNGYVMPNIVCWDLEFRLIPIVISTGDMKTCLASTTGHGWCVYSYSS